MSVCALPALSRMRSKAKVIGQGRSVEKRDFGFSDGLTVKVHIAMLYGVMWCVTSRRHKYCGVPGPPCLIVKIGIIMWRLVIIMLIHDLFRSSSTKHVWQALLDLVQTRPGERSRYHNVPLYTRRWIILTPDDNFTVFFTSLGRQGPFLPGCHHIIM